MVGGWSVEEVVADVLKNRGGGRQCDEIGSKVTHMAVGALFVTR